MQHVAISNGTLGVSVEGRGTPVLFVHGFPLTHAMWKPQIDTFSRSCRTIAPDLRGFGESTVTPDLVTMEQHADDLHALIHAMFLDKAVVLCALSMGGYVAWQFFRKYRPQLKALILCDTRAIADSPEAAAGRAKLAESVLAQGSQVAFETMKEKLFAPGSAESNPKLVEQVRSMVLRNRPAGIAAALHGLAQRPDVRDLLPTIDVPTLLLCGQHDVISPSAEMRTIAEAIPGARFVEIPDAGHMAPMENPDAVNSEILKFLAALR